MRVIRAALTKFEIAAELLFFLWDQKLWWMIPMMVVLILFALVIVFTQGTPLAPFIYTLF